MAVAQGEIINRVAQSGLITLNAEDYRVGGEHIFFDLKDWLYMGLILKEDDFRAQVKGHDWSIYTGKHIALGCSVDAIIPAWAYMLLGTVLQPFAATVIYGNLEDLEVYLYRKALAEVDFSCFTGQKVVVKGCGNLPIEIYVEITTLLRPYAQSIMYGEPCSTVPIYKKPKV